MWKLKVAGGEGPWLFSTNNFIGRQYWEFDPDYGTPEERAQVEKAREEYYMNRHQVKPSSDLLKQFQLIRENQIDMNVAPVNLKDDEEVTYEVLANSLTKAARFTSALQAQDGHWPAENSGSSIFMPPLLMALHITGALDTVLSSEHKREILRYIYNHQNEDGGWGSHVEGCSTMIGTVLNYIALRLLGETNDERFISKGQDWILGHGGATMVPSWGKIHLSIFGVYKWSGCNPVPPEFWMLPSYLPINPGKLWCCSRTVYAPISYLYGTRFVGPITDLVRSLRKELYLQPYDTIDWNKTRNLCAKEDLYVPHPFIQNLLWDSLYHIAEPVLKLWPLSRIRERALQKAMMLIHYEDENSRYITQGCIEKAFEIVACWVEDSNSDAFKFHLARVPDYFWLAEDGMKVQTFGSGSQLWDSAFSIQAILASDNVDIYGPTLRKAHNFIKQSQLQKDPSGDFKSMYRHKCKGAWTFSDSDHGWQSSDCTAEALNVLLLLSEMQPETVGEAVESERLYDAVNSILSLQSKNGGFSAWEPVVGQPWLELFNPTEFLSGVMVEHECIECTASVIHCLTLFKNLHGDYRKKDIETSVAKGLCYLKDTQRPDGSWYGSWGICFIYATWYALRGLAAGGKTHFNSKTVRKACRFLLSKQLESGGWGESYESCPNMNYVPLEGKRANVVQTSWAMMGLICAGQAEIDPMPIHRAAKFLIKSQNETGEFPQEEMTGCYMKNAILHYASYRSIFPLWALGEYRKHVPLLCKEIKSVG